MVRFFPLSFFCTVIWEYMNFVLEICCFNNFVVPDFTWYDQMWNVNGFLNSFNVDIASEHSHCQE